VLAQALFATLAQTWHPVSIEELARVAAEVGGGTSDVTE